MNEYKYPIGVTSQFSFCGLPFRLDTYSGCSFNCTYCFARLRGGFQHAKKLRPANPDKIIGRFKNAIANRDQNSIISQYVRRRMPIHFGGMSDPLQPLEKELGISLKILDFFSKIEYPTILSTKSTLVSSPEYLEVIKDNPNILVQFSLSTTIDSKSEISEPFSTAPSSLLSSIELLSKSGINTSIRWQPYIPKLSESPEEFVNTVSNCGIKHIGFEHLKLPVEKSNPLWRRLADSMDFDIRSYYKANHATVDGRESILPSLHKLKTIKILKEKLKSYDITLGVADNELQYMSDTDCCCSGADNFDGFKNWNKYQISYAIKKSLGNKIKFSTIQNEWKPTGSIDQHLNSDSRILKLGNSHNQIEDYIRNRWQNLDSVFNPTRFHNIIFEDEYDEYGMRIYNWTDNNK